MSKSRLPVTYENFDLLRDLATRLCWDRQYERAFSQLEHAGYILSALNIQDVGGEMKYLGEAADITDDMSCITQKLGKNGDACKYQNLRLQTLTSIETPLENFVNPALLDPDGDEILVLRDAYSAMAAICIGQADDIDRETQRPELALECFKNTHDFLKECALFSQNHVQVRNVRRKLASVCRTLNKTQQAQQYEALVVLSNVTPPNPAENRPYTNFKKIFFRATPGADPELYLPSGSHIGGSDENKAEIQKIATKLLILQEPSNAEARKKIIKKISATRTPQAKKLTKDSAKLEPTYHNVMTLKELAKTLCFENKTGLALPHLEHAASLLSQLTIKEAALDSPFADEAANILDDMSCIYQLRGEYKNAYALQMIRLQTLTGLESPLEVSFIVKHEDDKYDTYDLALADTHSALFSILNMEAIKMQSEGNLPKALKSLESANAMLERCFLLPDNNIQIVKTLLNIAGVLKAMNRDEEAQKYEALTFNRDYSIKGLQVPTYTNKDKIFYRPVHGGVPKLYMPSDEDNEAGPAMHLPGATDPKDKHKKKEHAFQCLRSLATMEFARKTMEADKAMQELLEHEEQEKKNTMQKASKKDKKKKSKAKQAQESQDAQQDPGVSASLLPLRLSPALDSPPLSLSPSYSMPPPSPLLPLSHPPSPSLAPPSPPLPLSPSASYSSLPPSPPIPLSPSASYSSLPPPSPPLPLSPPPSSQEVDIASYLEHFFCPISLEIMKDPVITADGSTFERARIEEWFRDHNTNPLTNEIVPTKTLIPNKTLKAAILAAQDLERALRISD